MGLKNESSITEFPLHTAARNNAKSKAFRQLRDGEELVLKSSIKLKTQFPNTACVSFENYEVTYKIHSLPLMCSNGRRTIRQPRNCPIGRPLPAPPALAYMVPKSRKRSIEMDESMQSSSTNVNGNFHYVPVSLSSSQRRCESSTQQDTRLLNMTERTDLSEVDVKAAISLVQLPFLAR